MRDTGQRLVAAAVEDCTSLAVWARTDEELVDALLVWHNTVQRLTAGCVRLVRELEALGASADLTGICPQPMRFAGRRCAALRDMQTVATAAIAAITFAALYAGHQLGDHVVQAAGQAASKGAPTAGELAAGAHPWTGWGACLRHVATYTATQAAALAVAWLAAPLNGYGVLAALAVSASTHAVIDRRWIVRHLIDLKRCHDWREAPYVLDQSLHMGALLIAAVVAARVGDPVSGIVVLALAVAVVATGFGVERRRAVSRRMSQRVPQRV